MPNKPRLLDQVRAKIRCKHYTAHGQAYVDWVRLFILFHNKRHPAVMGRLEVEQFLNYLALDRNVAASTQNQGLSALVFLYREVLEKELGWFGQRSQHAYLWH
jgi:hypothetical protein